MLHWIPWKEMILNESSHTLCNTFIINILNKLNYYFDKSYNISQVAFFDIKEDKMKKYIFIIALLLLGSVIIKLENMTENENPDFLENSVISPELKAKIEDNLAGFIGGFQKNIRHNSDHIKYTIQSSQFQIGFAESMLYFTIVSSSNSSDLDSIVKDKTQDYSQTTVFLELPGSNPVIPVVEKPTGIKSTYFIGNDHALSNQYYAKLYYYSIYDNIDLVYLMQEGQLKYEFYVHPGGNVNDIKFRWVGPVEIALNNEGIDISINTPNGHSDFLDVSPINYQGDREIGGSFRMIGEKTYGFTIADYNKNELLVIDPVYSTYVAGSDRDYGYSIALDTSGCVYVTGETSSSDFPTTPGANDTNGGGTPAFTNTFVFKLSANGSTLIYSTYVAGSHNDYGHSITLDTSGNAYVTGETQSTDFPTTPGANDTTGDATNFHDVFVFKLSADGSILIYSTYVAGSHFDYGSSITLDTSGNAYVTGETFSTDFPTTPGANDTTGAGTTSYQDIFVFKLSADGSTLIYSTYVAGNRNDYGSSIVLDTSGYAYVTGYTFSTDFPTTPGAYNETGDGTISNPDVYVFKVSPDGSTLVYSTYVAGSDNDNGHSIALDTAGNAYVTGETMSTDFPTTPGANDTTGDGSGFRDIFVFKLSDDGSALIYSTYVAGTRHDYAHSIALDISGNAYVAGETWSIDFITTPGANDRTGDGSTIYTDGIVFKLSADGGTLIYSSYLAGSRYDRAWAIALDPSGNAYITGEAQSTNFPTTSGAYNETGNGIITYEDAFVFLLDAIPPDINQVTDFSYIEGTSNNVIPWTVKDIASGEYNLTRNGTLIMENIPWKNGSLDIQINGLGLGIYNFTIYVYDSSKNLGIESVNVTVVDNTLPFVSQVGDFSYFESSSGNTISWSISDLHPEVYNVTLNGLIYNDTTSWVNETLIIKINELSLGTHNFTIYVYDSSGNLATESVNVTVLDNTLPVLNPVNDFSYNEDTTGNSITWSVGDLNPWIYNITRDGAPILTKEVWVGNTIILDIDALDRGTYTFIITIYDTSGNSRTDTVIITVIDSTLPKINLATVSPENGTSVLSGSLISLIISDKNLIKTEYNWDSKANQTMPLGDEVQVPSGDGEHYLYVYAIDAEGNIAKKVFLYYTDDTAPELTVSGVTQFDTVEGIMNLTITASDATGIDRIELHVDDVLYLTLNLTPYLFEINTTLLTNGEHTILIKAFDVLGNVNDASSYIITVENDSQTTTSSSTTGSQDTSGGDPQGLSSAIIWGASLLGGSIGLIGFLR